MTRSVSDPQRRRRAIHQAGHASLPIPANPLARTPPAHPSSAGCRGQRPPLNDHPLGQQPPAAPTERRVSVKLHPVTSLDLSCLRQRSASKEARMEPTYLGTTPSSARDDLTRRKAVGRRVAPVALDE